MRIILKVKLESVYKYVKEYTSEKLTYLLMWKRAKGGRVFSTPSTGTLL